MLVGERAQQQRLHAEDQKRDDRDRDRRSGLQGRERRRSNGLRPSWVARLRRPLAPPLRPPPPAERRPQPSQGFVLPPRPSSRPQPLRHSAGNKFRALAVYPPKQ